jgi:hypothetical protein
MERRISTAIVSISARMENPRLKSNRQSPEKEAGSV